MKSWVDNAGDDEQAREAIAAYGWERKRRGRGGTRPLARGGSGFIGLEARRESDGAFSDLCVQDTDR